jgi:hypothetical protein
MRSLKLRVFYLFFIFICFLPGGAGPRGFFKKLNLQTASPRTGIPKSNPYLQNYNWKPVVVGQGGGAVFCTLLYNAIRPYVWISDMVRDYKSSCNPCGQSKNSKRSDL